METTLDYNVVIATGISVVLVDYLRGLYFDIRKRNATRIDHTRNQYKKREEKEHEVSKERDSNQA